MKANPVRPVIYDFKCLRCGWCCTKMEAVVVKPPMVQFMAQHLDMSLEEFKDTYTFTRDDNTLVRQPCPFYDGKGCKIYENRPQACRDFPIVLIHKDAVGVNDGCKAIKDRGVMKREVEKAHEKSHILFIMMDSCRSDVFQKANTPNFSRVGEKGAAGAFACFTTPSVLGYMANFPPQLPQTYRPVLFPDTEQATPWAPTYFRERGYYTAWLSGNPMIHNFDMGTKLFSSTFDYYESMRYNLSPQAIVEIAKDVESVVSNADKEGKPVFMCILLMDTHMPYNDEQVYHFETEDFETNFANQVKAVEYIDKWFPAFVQPFLKTGKGVHTIVTADHGELMGEKIGDVHYWGHDPRDDHVVISTQLFKIPWLEAFIIPENRSEYELEVGSDSTTETLLNSLVDRVGIDKAKSLLKKKRKELNKNAADIPA